MLLVCIAGCADIVSWFDGSFFYLLVGVLLEPVIPNVVARLAFHAMVKRLVFAVNIAKYILTPASVSQGLVDSFLVDVEGGMHQVTLNLSWMGGCPRTSP